MKGLELAGAGPESQISKDLKSMVILQERHSKNIILNYNFSDGLYSWNPNSCEAYVVSRGSGLLCGVTSNSGLNYAAVTKRHRSWHGLEQDITDKVIPGNTYSVTACVRVYGNHSPNDVIATLKLENSNCPLSFVCIGRTSASDKEWSILEGTFLLKSRSNRVIFYLEGPPSGVDLLIDSVVICCIGQKESEDLRSPANTEENILENSNFSEGLKGWSARGCQILLLGSLDNGRVLPLSGQCFASTTKRSQSWNGIQQEITSRVQRKLAYEVTAVVRISGNDDSANVRVTLWVLAPNGREQYICVASLQALNDDWVELKGKFLLNGVFTRAIIYLEGPPPGTDVIIDSLVVKRATKPPPSPPLHLEGLADNVLQSSLCNTNIISNHDFSRGLHSWYLNQCDGYIITGDSGYFKGVNAKTGACYMVIKNRTKNWQGLEQDITAKVFPGYTYTLSAFVRIWGCQDSFEVLGTLRLEYSNSPTRYMHPGRALVSSKKWEKMEGSFTLEDMPKQVVLYIEGPPAGTIVLIDSVIIAQSAQQPHLNAVFNSNIIENSTFIDGLNSWIPLGPCTLSIHCGAPQLLPSVARASLTSHQPLSGRYVVASNRTETWMGPSQTIITSKLKLHLTYQVVGWVRVSLGGKGAQNINVALNIDDKWVNGGQVEVHDDRWHELSGSFRIETHPSKVVVYLQGPSPGIDVMLSGLNVFPVDRKARFDFLKSRTEMVRKRDVILSFKKADADLLGLPVKVTQMQNSFPLGSCINRSNLENEEFVDFFVKNFNCAVFGNELKWSHIEPQQGNFNYADADEMLAFCEKHGIQTRGHCIFWEVEEAIQPWVRSLNEHKLYAAIHNRLRSVLSRYKGRFMHYDVNNEMLHGSFYQDKLGSAIRAHMFWEAHQLDPSATLFVNDYHVEDGCDGKSSPEKYLNQILDLQKQGARVGGIGIQGHIDHPIGPIVSDALDKLSILGLPIWFTELDVCAVNEHVRADDLEVMVREAYAHPAVEGIMLWGFWEMYMCRDHSHLVDAEGEVNEAGKRLIALKNEWLSDAEGYIHGNEEFSFRGYHGKYNVEVDFEGKKVSKSFVVDKGHDPQLVIINL